MKRILAAVASLAAAIGISSAASAAQVTATTSVDTTWVGLDDSNATSINDDDPLTTLVTIAPGIVVNGVPTTFGQVENNFGSGIAGQSFLATKGGPIGNIQMRVGGAPSNYDIHLYNAGVGFPAGGPTGGTTYGTTAASNFADLLPADSWFKFNGSPTNPVLSLDLTPFNVSLIAGSTYIFEIVASQERDATGAKIGPVTPGSGAMTWFRNAGSNSYLPNGQAFRDRSALNGNADRSFAMAVHLVPEPASLALAGLSLLAIGALRRRAF